jgi:hypothetical protein
MMYLRSTDGPQISCNHICMFKNLADLVSRELEESCEILPKYAHK